MAEAAKSTIATATLTLLASRNESSSICPSEVARLVGDSLAHTLASGPPPVVIAGAPLGPGVAWRELMPLVRTCATEMAEEGSITVTQGHGANLRTVDLGSGKVVGPIRLRRGECCGMTSARNTR